MNRLNKFVKSFLVASLSLAFLMPNVAITSNAADPVVIGTEVSKYNDTGNYTPNILIETGTKTDIINVYGYKVSVKSSSSNLKLFKSTETSTTSETNSNSKQVTKSGGTTVSVSGYAKKAGTYKVTYTVKDINGTVVVPTQTLTVVAKDDVSPFKKITYAGQSLWTNEDSRFALSDDTNVYTTKKKGKLIVKPASGYKIKKIEVGTYNAVATETSDSTTTTTNKNSGKAYTNSSGTTSYVTSYNEYGQAVTGITTYKTVKSGKKITLGTVPYTYTRVTNNTSYTSTYEGTALLPATTVRVTYYDKTTKKTFVWSTNIIYAK